MADVDPYLSRPVRAARAMGILASWLIWIGALVVAVTTRIPQPLLLLILIAGFTPYIISIQLVEPWLMKRVSAKRGEPSP